MKDDLPGIGDGALRNRNRDVAICPLGGFLAGDGDGDVTAAVGAGYFRDDAGLPGGHVVHGDQQQVMGSKPIPVVAAAGIPPIQPPSKLIAFPASSSSSIPFMDL